MSHFPLYKSGEQWHGSRSGLKPLWAQYRLSVIVMVAIVCFHHFIVVSIIRWQRRPWGSQRAVTSSCNWPAEPSQDNCEKYFVTLSKFSYNFINFIWCTPRHVSLIWAPAEGFFFRLFLISNSEMEKPESCTVSSNFLRWFFTRPKTNCVFTPNFNKVCHILWLNP